MMLAGSIQFQGEKFQIFWLSVKEECQPDETERSASLLATLNSLTASHVLLC